MTGKGGATRRTILAGGLAAGAGAVSTRRARAAGAPIRLGVLTDMSSFGRDANGPGSVQAVRMAVEEIGGSVLDRPIEVLVADHQMKVDIGSQIARRWFDQEDVRAVVDVPNSAIGISVHNLAREKGRIALLGGTLSSEVTNALCSPNTAQFGLDTYALGGVTASAIMADGAKTWFFVTADFAFGHALEADARAVIDRLGGKVLGSVRHPFGNADFSSFLIAAQASGADVIAFANSSADTLNSIKQAAEFGLIGSRQKIASMLFFETDIHALGLATANGVYVPLWTYWTQDERARAWSQRFFSVLKTMPTMPQAGSYSGALHYLKAVRAAGTTETPAVMAKMRELPLDDAFIRNGVLRADGRVVKDVMLGRVRAPGTSPTDWDDVEILRTIPGDQAFRPLADSRCPLVRT